MKGLWRYLEGRKLRAALMVLVGAGNAAAQTGGSFGTRSTTASSPATRAT